MLALLLAGTCSAHAALDDAADAVGAEAQRLGARWSQPSQVLARPVHRLEWADGSSLRQYAGSDGRIWALAWNLRTAPRLDLLLGPHAAAWRAALRGRPASTARHGLQLEAGDLVVESHANGNAWIGRAWLRSRVPAGQGHDVVR